jgi:hypothetical protein
MTPPAILRPFDLAEVIGTDEAARRAGVSERAMREWCCRHHIGRRIGGRWNVSQVALQMLLNGDAQGLEDYLSGLRATGTVQPYYEQLGLTVPSTAAPSRASVSADYAAASGSRM